MQHIQAIAAFGPRDKGSEAEAKAASYISQAFTQAGYEVTTQQVALAKGGSSVNVVARFPRVDYSAGYILVGGHYDTIPASPGANDNASGTGVIIAIAEAVREHPRPIEFVAFTAEERDPVTRKHHEGSLAYAANMPVEPTAMVSVDMIANTGPLMVSEDRAARTAMAAEVHTLAAALGIPTTRRVEGDVSDHTSFSRRGIDAVLLWTTRHASFHKPSDTIAVVQPDAVGRAGTLVLAWVRSRALI